MARHFRESQAILSAAALRRPLPSEAVVADQADRLHAPTHQMKDHRTKDVSA